MDESEALMYESLRDKAFDMAWTLRKIDEELSISAQCEGDYPGGYPPERLLPNLCKIMYASQQYHKLPEMMSWFGNERTKTMSETYERIQEAIKVAMKSGDNTTRDVLRMVVSDIKNKTVNEGKEIAEEVVIACLKKFAKQIEDSITSANNAGRIDLEEKSKGELSIVSKFLPSMIPNDQVEGLIDQILSENEEKLGRPMTKKDFGNLMKMLPSNCDKKYCAKVLQGLLK